VISCSMCLLLLRLPLLLLWPMPQNLVSWQSRSPLSNFRSWVRVHLGWLSLPRPCDRWRCSHSTRSPSPPSTPPFTHWVAPRSWKLLPFPLPVVEFECLIQGHWQGAPFNHIARLESHSVSCSTTYDLSFILCPAKEIGLRVNQCGEITRS